MNCKTITLILAASLAAFGVGAQEATPEPAQTSAGPAKTRAQVQQELAQARADGSIAAVSAGYAFASRAAATKSRSQVQGELLLARASGQFGRMNAEAHDFMCGVDGVTQYARHDATLAAAR